MTLNGVVNSSSPNTGSWMLVLISWLPSESDPGARNAPNVTAQSGFSEKSGNGCWNFLIAVRSVWSETPSSAN
jgi:hypothetical protein